MGTLSNLDQRFSEVLPACTCASTMSNLYSICFGGCFFIPLTCNTFSGAQWFIIEGTSYDESYNSDSNDDDGFD